MDDSEIFVVRPLQFSTAPLYWPDRPIEHHHIVQRHRIRKKRIRLIGRNRSQDSGLLGGTSWSRCPLPDASPTRAKASLVSQAEGVLNCQEELGDILLRISQIAYPQHLRSPSDQCKRRSPWRLGEGSSYRTPVHRYDWLEESSRFPSRLGNMIVLVMGKIPTAPT